MESWKFNIKLVDRMGLPRFLELTLPPGTTSADPNRWSIKDYDTTFPMHTRTYENPHSLPPNLPALCIGDLIHGEFCPDIIIALFAPESFPPDRITFRDDGYHRWWEFPFDFVSLSIKDRDGGSWTLRLLTYEDSCYCYQGTEIMRDLCLPQPAGQATMGEESSITNNDRTKVTTDVAELNSASRESWPLTPTSQDACTEYPFEPFIDTNSSVTIWTRSSMSDCESWPRH